MRSQSESNLGQGSQATAALPRHLGRTVAIDTAAARRGGRGGKGVRETGGRRPQIMVGFQQKTG